MSPKIQAASAHTNKHYDLLAFGAWPRPVADCKLRVASGQSSVDSWRIVIELTNKVSKKFVQLVASLTPHCHEITRLLSESMERRLPLRKRLLIRLHFSICLWCKRYDGQLKLLRKYSTGFAEKGCEQGREILPSGARERLNKALEEISD